MFNKEAQGKLELSRSPGAAPENDAVNGSMLDQRLFRPRNVASILLALVVLYLMYQELLVLDWHEALASMRETNMALFALAFALFYCSFVVRALRWETLLTNVGYDRTAVQRMPSPLGLTIARLGDAYRGYLLKKLAGVSFAVTPGTVLTERLLDTFVLATMMGTSLLVVFHGSLPMQVTPALATGLILTAVGVLGLLSMRRLRGAVERVLPKRLHAHYARLEHGVVGSFRRLPLLVAYSIICWLIEGATLYVTAAAVGVPVSVAGALVVALAAALLTTYRSHQQGSALRREV